MATISKKKSIYFNDVNILAGITKVNSRSEIPIQLDRIFASPMPAVVGETFAKRALDLGLSVCLHRFCSVDEQLNLFKNLLQSHNVANLFCAVGLDEIERLHTLRNGGCFNFLLDIANGTVPKVKDFCIELEKSGEKLNKFAAGNVITAEGFEWLYRNMQIVPSNSYLIRVGQGNGLSCKTSDETGINRGQITELMEISERRNQIDDWNSVSLISDGGISKAGFAAKAFGAGADCVLIGGMFARALEAETHMSGDGTYFGCASHKAQSLLKGKPFRHTEGKEEIRQEDKKPLKEIVEQLWGGISSAISYSGYSNLNDFIGNATFEIKENSLPPKQRY